MIWLLFIGTESERKEVREKERERENVYLYKCMLIWPFMVKFRGKEALSLFRCVFSRVLSTKKGLLSCFDVK